MKKQAKVKKTKFSIAGYNDWKKLDGSETYYHLFTIIPSLGIYDTGYMFEIALSWMIWTIEFRWEKLDD